MYLITTYGNWNYECYAYDFSSVPPNDFEMALKLITESGEDIWDMHEEIHDEECSHKPPDKIFIWDILRWVEKI